MRKPKHPPGPAAAHSDDANWFDKLFKELLQNSLPQLASEVLHVPASQYRPMPVELHRTLEKRADFLGKLYGSPAEKSLLHLEIQLADERNMVYRELLYAALILDKHKGWELEQIVLCIGPKRPVMPTELQRKRLGFSFRLVWIKDIPYREFLKTGNPELMLLAALADFEGKSPKTVMEEIFNGVHQTTPSQLDFDLKVAQLHIFSGVHNLHQIFDEVMAAISVYELPGLRRDPFYKKGKREGKREGIFEGQLIAACNLIRNSDHPDSFVASMTGLEESVVRQIRSILLKNPKATPEAIAEQLAP